MLRVAAKAAVNRHYTTITVTTTTAATTTATTTTVTTTKPGKFLLSYDD